MRMKRKNYILYILAVGLVLLLIGLASSLILGGEKPLIPINFALILVFIAAIYEASKLKE
jgi:ABC-type iron transport system FetAB permease component